MPPKLKAIAKGQIKKGVKISTPYQSEWQKVCQILSSDYKLAELKSIATDFGISIEGQTKRQLCAKLAQVMCINPHDLALDDVDINDPSIYKYKEPGNHNSFCFSKSDYDDYISKKKQNPYNRQPIQEDQLTKMNLWFHPNQIERRPINRPLARHPGIQTDGFLVSASEKSAGLRRYYRVSQRLPIIAQMWRELSDAEKEHYNLLARQY